MGRDHARAAPLACLHRDGRRGGGEVQVPSLQIERLRLAQRGVPQQQDEQPRLDGGRGGHDMPDLFRRTVVGQFARGILVESVVKRKSDP